MELQFPQGLSCIMRMKSQLFSSLFQSSAAHISVIVLQTKKLPSIDNRQTKLKVCHSEKQSFFPPHKEQCARRRQVKIIP